MDIYNLMNNYLKIICINEESVHATNNIMYITCMRFSTAIFMRISILFLSINILIYKQKI